MYTNHTERMPRTERAARVVKPKRGKSTADSKRATIARRQARALKYGGQR